MEIKFDKLASIHHGNISINDLMIFCGENNTGKTYASYVLYSLFEERFRTELNYFDENELKTQGSVVVDLENIFEEYENIKNAWAEEMTRSLPELFSTGTNEFSNTRINLHTDLEETKQNIFHSPLSHHVTLNRETLIQMLKPLKSFKVEIKLLDGALEQDEDFNFSYMVRAGVARRLDHFVFQEFYSETFLLPAERAGLNLFYKELNASRNELLYKITTESKQNNSLTFDLTNLTKEISTYAKPISDYLTFLNRLSVYSKREPGTFSDLALKIQEYVLKGKYDVDDNGIQYIAESSEDRQQTFKLGLHASSSTVKTLFGLVFYLNYIAAPGKTLIIDEPELNLHPDNQRKLARILAEATNRGLRIILSTHSDYIIKEFNNLIMLFNEFEDKDMIMQKFGYEKSQILNPQKVAAYMFADHTISKIEINENEGIIAETFNDVINQYNDSNDEIYYSLLQDGPDEKFN